MRYDLPSYGGFSARSIVHLASPDLPAPTTSSLPGTTTVGISSICVSVQVPAVLPDALSEETGLVGLLIPGALSRGSLAGSSRIGAGQRLLLGPLLVQLQQPGQHLVAEVVRPAVTPRLF